MRRYTLAELEAMPTLAQGHFDNEKYNDGEIRILLSRMTVADGAQYNNGVLVEQLDEHGNWTTVDEYEAK